MDRGAVLAVHVVAGVVGLLTGPGAIRGALRGGRAGAWGPAYLTAVSVLAATALGLVAFAPARLWPFALLAAGTEVALVAGLAARRRGAPGWLRRHVRLVGGSYVSLVTALVVVSWGSVLAWVLPTVVGTVLVERATGRAARAAAPERLSA